MQLWPKVDGAIKAAAVADYTPKIVADHKIKKQEAQLAIELVPTRDILAAMGREKKRINGWLASPWKRTMRWPTPRINSNAKTLIISC